ncbi:hypothetical protein NKJ46_03195 [Mesorhizobium sp. M0166]|jgi:membrane protein YdbS with pleckstrin-like domain|uniref:hypothetical protein n=1 Tax=unclassified Mesorhizobium TaxID=325217 RepID=UPI0003CF6CE9|nr:MULTISPECIES: hypothetical protein [unclassified Mesorhizobium]ESX69996.1 hypothetical protein X759_22625 [Mesorhizobium sp. LSHC420B00]
MLTDEGGPSLTVKVIAMMNGPMGTWMMGGMALVWVLVFVALLLAIAALVKYLRT